MNDFEKFNIHIKAKISASVALRRPTKYSQTTSYLNSKNVESESP